MSEHTYIKGKDSDLETTIETMLGKLGALGIDFVEGRENFDALHSPGLSLDGFDMHKRLLDGYRKLQKAKLNNWPE